MTSRPSPDDPRSAGRPSAGSRLGLLRDLGDQSVLQAIFHAGPVTRPEIAAATGLSKPTVSSAVSRLEREGLVRADGARSGQRGRSPIAYVVSGRAGFVVGCDIGATTIRVAAADLFGEPLDDLTEPTAQGGSGAIAAQVAELVDRLVRRTRKRSGTALAIGLSVPGIIEETTGRVTSLAHNVAPEGGFHPAAMLRERLGLPVYVENDVNMAAIGEKWFGAARGVATMVFIAVGAGVGMGMVIDDELVRGAHGAAGEIGYLPLTTDPFDPRHRLHGGLEDEVAAAGIVAAHARLRGDGAAPAASAQEVFARAAGGEDAAREVVAQVATRLGAAIATVCAVIDPELVVLGGGIGANPLLLGPVRRAAEALVPIAARIEGTGLGDRAALQGAIGLSLRAARERLLSPAALVGGST